MFFFEALGIWIIYVFGIGVLVWAVAFIILAFVANHRGKKEREAWMQTEGYEQMRVNSLVTKERLESIGIPYEDEYTKYATYDELKKAREEEKQRQRKAQKPIDTEFEKWQRSNH